MQKLGLKHGLVRRSSAGILPLHDVIPGYLQWAPQSLHGAQCFLDPMNIFPQMQLMVCHNQVTPGAAALLRTRVPRKYTSIQTLKQNHTELLTGRLWRWQPRCCYFSPCSTPSCTCWYNHNWAEVGTQTALLCWDQPAQPYSWIRACCALSCCCFLPLAPPQPSHSDSTSGPCLTTLAIILLPGCEKTTLINVFWRNPLPATLGKMLQEADVQA